MNKCNTSSYRYVAMKDIRLARKLKPLASNPVHKVSHTKIGIVAEQG